MKRLALLLSPLALAGAACVAVPVAEGPAPVAYPAPPPAPPPVYPAPARAPIEAWYGGEHFVPDAYGGGWCYEGRPHRHDFYPDQPDAYVLEGGYYYYRGPLAFTYYEGHPVPGGGWCYARGPHRHEFLPPRGSDFSWRRDRGYVYQGSWRPHRPPPATYWPRVPARTAPAPAPYPSRAVPAPAPYSSRPVPAPAPEYRGYPVRPAPAPAPRHDERDRRDAAPGHGNLPPGHGGTPPGQVTAPPAGRDRRDDRSGPGRSDRAPGHANLPPGQGGLPPGQAKRAEAAPAASAPAAVPPAPAAPAPAASAPAPARRSAPAPGGSAPTRQRGDRDDDRSEETDGGRPARQVPTR